MERKKHITSASVIRKLLLAWIAATAVEYTFSLGPLNDLSTLAGMSLLRLSVLTVTAFLLLLLLGRRLDPKVERWAMVVAFSWLAVLSLISSYTPAFLVVCLLILSALVWYALRGWNCSPPVAANADNKGRAWLWAVGILSAAFFLFVGSWTVCRVYSFCTPSYDFGIFSQMFYNMKESGLPLTTLERDGLLSHFDVHVSPIYYLLLPFYCLVPTPATLQVLQAAVLVSGVIPLWLLGKRHGLSPALRTILCAVLLLYPAYSGGASYDIHENAFLTPLILWLFYAIDSRNNILCGIFTLLVLMVKEDAAVYTAVIALFVIVRSIIGKEGRRQITVGLLMLAVSVGWFMGATGHLARNGDGVMTYRYNNFIYDGSSSLVTVILSVLLCPMKAVFECVDPEKLSFIGYTLIPLLGLPFLTRRFERYLLLIPYVLVNLMSDYQYQHDIFFQYTYGSTACLFYLTVVNLADSKLELTRFAALTASAAVCIVCFIGTVIPKAQPYPRYCLENKEHYDQVRQVLDTIPDDASVCATTFYTTYLSQREVLHDVRYASTEHLLDCEYIVLTTTSESCYKNYAVNGENGLNNLVSLLYAKGYTLAGQLDGTLVIYQKG